MENRKHPRFETRFDVLLSSGSTEGAGLLVDLSYAGAQLENTSYTPEVGSAIRLYVFVQPVSPFELSGHVVRHTEHGFAVALDGISDEARRLVDDVRGMVG